MMALAFRDAADFAGLGDQASAGDRNLHGNAGSLSCHGTPNSATRKSRPFRKRQGFSNGPSGFDATHKRTITYTQLLSPSGKRLRLSVKTDQPVVSLIAALHCVIGPPYITRSVVSMIVDAIQSQSVRWPHIGGESFERLEVRRYFNTAPSIVRIGWVVGILAATPHILPDSIVSLAGLPVRTASIADIHGTMTAARHSVSRHEFFGPYGFCFGPAIAITAPAGSASSIRRSVGHGQFPESLPGQITKTRPHFASSFTGLRRHADLVRSARLRIAVQKIRSSDGRFLAAVATAKPICLALLRERQPQYRQLAESLIAEIQDTAAATRDRVPVFEIARGNQYFLSASASAIPAHSTASRIGPSLKHGKVAEHLARKIFRYPGHKPAVYINYRG